jgi:hypothetical protein
MAECPDFLAAMALDEKTVVRSTHAPDRRWLSAEWLQQSRISRSSRVTYTNLRPIRAIQRSLV